jgi:hypothetical protein
MKNSDKTAEKRPKSIVSFVFTELFHNSTYKNPELNGTYTLEIPEINQTHRHHKGQWFYKTSAFRRRRRSVFIEPLAAPLISCNMCSKLGHH